MDYKINFDEPIPKMIDRLRREHDDFESNLEKIQKHLGENQLKMQ